MKLGEVPKSGTFAVKQKFGRVTLNSPLISAGQIAPIISRLAKSGIRVFTVDFALSRSKDVLRKSGLTEGQIYELTKDLNKDHHDEKNTGKTATEVVLGSISQFKGKYAVITNHIDDDSLCSAFAALKPEMAKKHEAILTEVARYGDYLEEVSVKAMQISLAFKAIVEGKNKFDKGIWDLTQEQKGELFNEILSKMPQMLTNIGLFKNLYESKLAELTAQKERAIKEGLVWTFDEFVAVADNAVGKPPLDRSVVYQVSNSLIAISRTVHGNGTFKYDPIGVHPRISVTDKQFANIDLSKLWPRLALLENKERARKGLPPLEDSERWGGLPVAGGSPRLKKAKDNEGRPLGSVLTLEQVANEIKNYLLERSQI
jgi:hypothetical protein